MLLYTIESVADPAPAFASTTSVPPFWILFVRYSVSEGVKLLGGFTWGKKKKTSISRSVDLMKMSYWYETCDNSGKIVTPACPPTTGTSTSLGSSPRTSAFTRLSSKVKSWWLNRSQQNHVKDIIIYHKGVGTSNIECSNTKELLRIISSSFLENLSGNSHSGVHRVTNQVDDSIRTAFCYSLT